MLQSAILAPVRPLFSAILHYHISCFNPNTFKKLSKTFIADF